MKAAELIERLKDVDPESIVYLDSEEMPTCLSIAQIRVEVCKGYIVVTGEEITIPTVTLATYVWEGESDDNT
jgi:hypothetical protein